MSKSFILTGLISYDPEKAFNGYTLYAPMQLPTPKWNGVYSEPSYAYLIDMKGNEVHRWHLPCPPGLHGVLLQSGHLLVSGIDGNRDDPDKPGSAPGYKYRMGGAAGYLFELDWEGNILFQYHDPYMHHYFDKLPSGNYIYVQWEKMPEAMRKDIRGGIKDSEFTEEDGTLTMFADNFIEINPKGKILWEWHAVDHLDFDKDIIGPIHGRGEWTHYNDVHFFMDENGREKLITTGRHVDCMHIIDRESGAIQKRIGSVSYLDPETGCLEYRRSSGPITPQGITTLGGPHAAHVIPEGYPGAGNYLVYDNGMYGDSSRAVEYSKDSTTENPIVAWESCQGVIGRRHYSNFISGVQRLPNGNTLICDGAMGRFFEIAAGTYNEIVWEYVNPHTPDPLHNGTVFRAHRYGPDYCTQFNTLPGPN
jgi:hypothetical protein